MTAMIDSAPSDRSRFYSVAELAREFSLTSQGIRFYEESGLIAPARVGRTRVFNYQDRARLGLIQRLRRLGFSIEAIRDYLSLYKADATGAAQYRRGLERIAERIEELESKRRRDPRRSTHAGARGQGASRSRAHAGAQAAAQHERRIGSCLSGLRYCDIDIPTSRRVRGARV
jgi:DNA-binding transcriptional MerR regulator